MRQRILFELWRTEDERVDVEIVLCRSCGFLAFRPRPTPKDLTAKYRFLDRLAEKRFAKHPLKRIAKPLDEVDVRRSHELATALSPFVTTSRPTALDFGGRSGALMTALVEREWRCGVVDFTTTTQEGVERLGNTLDDVSSDRRFDVVIASHVFEHLADPRATLERLAARLTTEGIVFIEVPLEILGRAPPLDDPVTHINFFSETSLAVLMMQSGLEILSARHERCTFESGRTAIGVRAIGRRAKSSLSIDYGASVEQVRTLLRTRPELAVGPETTAPEDGASRPRSD